VAQQMTSLNMTACSEFHLFFKQNREDRTKGHACHQTVGTNAGKAM
jgi:hypothetical protein